MCRKYVLASSPETLELRFGVSFKALDWEPGIIVSPGNETVIITQQDPARFLLSGFGMTPSRSKQSMQILNARAEGDKNKENDPSFNGSRAIFLKPAFQKLLFSRRCIVPADAFLAWTPEVFSQPYLLFLRQHEHPFGMAGLYDTWTDPSTGTLLHSFTIITVPGNSLLRKINNARMPVILPRGRESRWLKPELSLTDILAQLQMVPSARMNAFPLGGKVNTEGPFTKDILNPAGARLLSEEPVKTLPRQSHYGHKTKTDSPGPWPFNGPG